MLLVCCSPLKPLIEHFDNEVASQMYNNGLIEVLEGVTAFCSLIGQFFLGCRDTSHCFCN